MNVQSWNHHHVTWRQGVSSAVNIAIPRIELADVYRMSVPDFTKRQSVNK